MNLKKVFVPLPEIISDKIILREITQADAEEYRKVVADEISYRYWGYKMSEEERDVIGKIEYNRSALLKLSEITWGIAERKTNRIVGEIHACKFHGTRKYPQSICEIGYRISPEMWGKGYASLAVNALVKFIFENTNVNRIQAVVMKENPASVKVLEKNGFAKEGLLRQIKVYQCIADCYMLSILRNDFENRK